MWLHEEVLNDGMYPGLNDHGLDVWVEIIKFRYSMNAFICKSRAEVVYEGISLLFTLNDSSSIAR